MPKPQDSRPPLVVAMTWVNRLTTISIEMVLPAVLGYWGDKRWGTRPLLVAIGALLGFSIAMWHLLKIANRDNGGR